MAVEKRVNEWSILRTVYDVSQFSEVRETERPDFLMMRNERDAHAFGVEVTELFANQADARAVNHPDYLPALFAGAPHMHKDDPRLLPVARMRLTDSDGNLKQEDLPGILTRTPSNAEHRRSLAAVIGAKSSRGYRVEDGHVNLIIRDRFFLSGETLNEEYSVTDLLSDGIREALIQSPFREVFLISVAHNGQQVVRPLNQLMLAERFFFFGKALEATINRPDMGGRSEYVQAFAEFCEREGEFGVDLKDHQGRPFAAYRSGAVGLCADLGMELLDFADRRVNLPPWDWQSGLEPLTDDELECCRRFVADNGFSWGYYGTPHEPAQLQFPNVRTVEVVEVPRNESPDGVHER